MAWLWKLQWIWMIINCLVNSGKWAVVHEYGIIEMGPTQVTCKRCLWKHPKYFISEAKYCQACKSNVHFFLEHNVYLEKTLSNFPFVATLMLTHRHWSLTFILDYFCVFIFKTLGLYLANSLFFQSLLSPQLEFLIEENKWCLKLPIRNL